MSGTQWALSKGGHVPCGGSAWQPWSQIVCFKAQHHHLQGTAPYCSPLQYSCLENPMDGGAWWAAVHGVAKSRTQLSDFTVTFHFHALEKKMATHSSVLAWRIPGTGEPGGLPSMGSHRVQHDWSDLAVSRGYTLKFIVTRIRSWNSYLWIRHLESRHRSLKQRILIKSPVLRADRSKFKSPPPTSCVTLGRLGHLS